MIKIQADKLKTFVEKCTANGTIQSCNLNFQKDGLFMQNKDEDFVICISGLLAKNNFAEYEEMILNMPSSTILLKTLGTFDKNVINIVQKENMVRFMDENGGVDLTLAEKVDCYVESLPELEYDNKFIVKKSTMETIIERQKLVDSDNMVEVINKNKKLTFKMGKMSNLAESFVQSTEEKEIRTLFNLEYFEKLINKMDPIVDLSINQELPSKFEENNDKYRIIYFLTPITEEK